MDSTPKIEIAIEEASHASQLNDLGIDRIELCANLAEGGITPTLGQAAEVVSQTQVPVYAMLRPRSGDFTYSPSEQKQLLFDLEAMANTGIAGVVFGALKSDGKLDYAFVAKVFKRAQDLGLGTTFHRAFDACSHPFQALEALIDMGVERVLTSGGATFALQGKDQLKEVQLRADGRIEIMAGAGVNAEVLPSLWSIGIRSFHSTARRLTYLASNEQLSHLGFDRRWMLDKRKVHHMVTKVKELSGSH